MSKKDRVIGLLAGLLLLVVLVVPGEPGRLTMPAAYVRLPVELLAGAVLYLAVAPRARKAVAVALGALVGLLVILKMLDIGFHTFLDRPFEPVGDWPFLKAAVDFVAQSYGNAAAVGAAVIAALLAVGVMALTTLAVLRVTRLLNHDRTTAGRAVAVLAVAWVAFAVLDTQIVAGVPVAARPSYDRVHQVHAGFKSRDAFADELHMDAFRDTPGADLLTALRGKDVLVVYVESYGRVAVEDPGVAPRVETVLDAGDRRLRAAGFKSRSAFLTSPTSGGGSWLAHDTLLSGLWVDNQQRHEDLLASDRLTLNGAFRRAGWRTVAVMPAVAHPWPEGVAFFGYDKLYIAPHLGYQGPKYSFGTMPDQYTLSVFQRLERATPGHVPVMAEIPLVSSHAPWDPVPSMLGWNSIGDGSVFRAEAGADAPAEAVFQRDRAEVRLDYARSIEYSLNALISYVETYGDDNTVLVFLGDHQPAAIVAGLGASHDVPISIVAKDQSVLDRIAGWGWGSGLKPDPRAPVWRMDAFRDRFLTAFGSLPSAQMLKPAN
jgi:hypothetical protein